MTALISHKQAGVWQPISQAHRKVSGTWRQYPYVWRKIAGTWQLVHTRAGVGNSYLVYGSKVGANPSGGVNFYNNGSSAGWVDNYVTASQGPGTWHGMQTHADSGLAIGYGTYLRVTKQSGLATLQGLVSGTWYELDVTRTPYVTGTTTPGYHSLYATYDIAVDQSGTKLIVGGGNMTIGAYTPLYRDDVTSSSATNYAYITTTPLTDGNGNQFEIIYFYFSAGLPYRLKTRIRVNANVANTYWDSITWDGRGSTLYRYLTTFTAWDGVKTEWTIDGDILALGTWYGSPEATLTINTPALV